VKVFMFHLMPWPHLPEDYEGSAWVWCPNRLYDPARGQELYNRYLDELLYAEELGFDGVCVNEHHQNAYGNMPSPNLVGFALARQSQTMRIAVLGNALPLYDPPQRVAEEYAMIDVVSGGRLIAGLVIGGGPEYYSFGINPTEARGRFREALELVLQAWTRPGPFEFEGEYYSFRYVNIWPRPLQVPHPPIWIPGGGSIETIEYVAQRRWSYMGIPYFATKVFKKNFDDFRDAAQRLGGYEAHPEQMGLLLPVYVSTSDARAREEIEPHMWYFARKLLKGIFTQPPGYTSARSLARVATTATDFIAFARDWEDVMANNYIVCGSPETVRQKLAGICEQLGMGNLLALLHLGGLSPELTRQNQELFANEVMPFLRKEFPCDQPWPDPLPLGWPLHEGLG
jgi:alkanesulfonate monooxygenase SsuD/methylene tetrahydromethanopterin reductase-like flavin-dependent oxidoreductase (luciferase family)